MLVIDLGILLFIATVIFLAFAAICHKTAQVAVKVAENNPQLAKYAGLAVPVVAIAAMAQVLTPGVTVVAGWQAIKWAGRNWKDQDDNIKAADDKRAEATRS